MNDIDASRVRVAVTRNDTGSYFIVKQVWSTKHKRYISDVREGQPAQPVTRDTLLDDIDAVLDAGGAS